MSLIKNLEKINIIWFKFWAVDFNNEKNYVNFIRNAEELSRTSYNLAIVVII